MNLLAWRDRLHTATQTLRGDFQGAPPACCFSFLSSFRSAEITFGLLGQSQYGSCPQILFVVTRWCRLP